MSKQTAAPATDYSAQTADTLVAIGARIRELRVRRGLSLQAFSELTGLSVSMLSIVERGKTSPSIGTLVVICSVLGVQMGDLLVGGPHAERDPVSRAGGQPVLETSSGVLRRILRDDPARGVEIAINEYAPNTGSALEPVRHAGYEYGTVLEGELTVEVDGTRHVLGPGDLISYESSRPHRIWNYNKVRARALWVNLQNASRSATGSPRVGSVQSARERTKHTRRI